MKKHGDYMKDPKMNVVVYNIEKILRDYDEKSGRKYNDSVIKTVLVQTMARLAGKPPKKTPGTEKEQFQHDVSMMLMAMINRKNSPYSKLEYKTALKVVDGSLKTRREYHNSPRGYLDYLIEFMADIPTGYEATSVE